ncbi:MAG: hypothetical protein ABIA93_01255 [Candidatus Woesearchaeota archaeon]
MGFGDFLKRKKANVPSISSLDTDLPPPPDFQPSARPALDMQQAIQQETPLPKDDLEDLPDIPDLDLSAEPIERQSIQPKHAAPLSQPIESPEFEWPEDLKPMEEPKPMAKPNTLPPILPNKPSPVKVPVPKPMEMPAPRPVQSAVSILPEHESDDFSLPDFQDEDLIEEQSMSETTLKKEGSLFVDTKDYRNVMQLVREIKEIGKDGASKGKALNSVFNNQDKTLQQWHNHLEKMQNTLIGIDEKLFER